VRASDLGFRLAPRINAAGRLGHPGAALDLLLTTDDERATELADKLETLNRRRQSVEEEILEDAVSMVEARDEDWRERRAYVLASPDWHEGVIGIVASRLVERFKRPVVLIAIGPEQAKGSGRSIPAYDLHSGLAAAGDCLLRFGGHRAAAGLTIDPARIPELAERLAAHASGALDDSDLNPPLRVDAVVAPAELSLELADELARLEPFGLGNPDVTLLCPAAAVHGVEAMGEGRHLRMAVELGGFRCRAVGFGLGATLAEMQQAGRVDVAFRLHRNEWNGTVTPQMVLRAVQPLGEPVPLPGLPAEPAHWTGSGYRDCRQGGVQVATVARLLAGGCDCAVVVADRARRERAIAKALRPDRFGAATLALVEYGDPAAERFGELVVLDPPADPEQAAWLDACSTRSAVHLVWGASEVTFVRDLAHQREPLRDTLAAVWRALRAGAAPEVSDATLEQCLRVLDELGIDPQSADRSRVELESSPTYRAAAERAAAVDRFLEGIASPAAAVDDSAALVPAAG
jgi:single-stranded-DNA-specific exonuclease